MPPTSSTDKHPPDNESERPSPLRRSQRIRKVEERSTDVVSKHRPTPLPSKPHKRQREGTEYCTQVDPPQKRYRPTDYPEPSPNPPPTDQQAATSFGQCRTSHIAHWAQQGQVWPSKFFEVNKMLPRRRSIASLRRKRSDASVGTLVTPSDLTTNDAVYRHPNYAYIMEKEAGSFLKEHKEGVTQASKQSRRISSSATILSPELANNLVARTKPDFLRTAPHSLYPEPKATRYSATTAVRYCD
ncbi:MAG: hypothetical protein Q9198_001495 [Flavoplaca austrocitrina]